MVETENERSMVEPLALESIFRFHLVVSKHGGHIIEVFACAVIPWKGVRGRVEYEDA
jgi:hypothetical protein